MEANAKPVSIIRESQRLIKRWSLYGSILAFLFAYPLGIGLSIMHTKTLIESLVQGSRSHIIQLAQQPEGWVDVSRFLKGLLDGDLVQGIRIVDPKNGFALVQMERENESVLHKMEPSLSWEAGLFVGDREFEMTLTYHVPMLLIAVICFVLALCIYMVFNLSSYRLVKLLRSTARDISGLMEKVAASAGSSPLHHDAKIEEVATLQGAYNALLERVSTAESGRRNDLAEKMRLEERATANKKLIDVLQAAIHDFKSPIGTFRRYLEIQRDMMPAHRNALESAQARMEEIIAGMSRKEKELFEHGNEELRRVTILEFVAEKVVQEKRFSFDAISIAYAPENLLSPAAIDAQSFERILVNLIDNAIDACDRVDAHVRVKFGRSDKDEIEVMVEDNGRGISAEVLSRLFQRGATFGKKNGQGLGLFSVRQILTDLGGQIHLESQVGVGTKAIVTLPLASDARILRALPGLRGRVAVLDDDPLIHSLVDQALSEAASVEHFHSPDAFSSWRKVNTASGFLMDMNLGNHAKESGLDVIEREAIQSNAILVTNDFECAEVLERAARIAVPVFPKSLLTRLAVAQMSAGR